jgi:hypothetical protein
METNTIKMWVVCLKSKKDPVRIEAACVKSENGRYVFADEAGDIVGAYDVTAVDGYSVEPIASSNTKPGITIIVDGAPSE